MSSCGDCDLKFSRKDNLMRHLKNKHGYIDYETGGVGDGEGGVTLQHPFTMTLAGPTGSGKTFWMKRLLENTKSMIKPNPERIIWCYKRWQPMFNEMKQTVKHIVFVHGIPEDLNEDSFIDTKFPTLIILDDLMKDVASSQDVCELFVEGSHHRNLSVACLVQNPFYKGKGSRTMSINSQYLVLFKNPRDQVGPSTLARQMYPKNSNRFMKKYTEGTKQPYGYLFIDLKQTTPDDERLKTNVFEGATVQIGGSQYTNRDTSDIAHLKDIHQGEQTHCDESLDTKDIEIGNSHDTDKHINDKMPSCDDCGLVFESVPDLVRHVNRWCPENKRKFDDIEVDESTTKKRKIVIKDGEEVAFERIATYTRESNENEWQTKVDKYISEGLVDKKARIKANHKFKAEEMDDFTSRYADLLTYMLQLQDGHLHKKVITMIERLVKDGMDYKKAIKISTRKYKPVLEGYLVDVIENETYENDEDEDSNGEESE